MYGWGISNDIIDNIAISLTVGGKIAFSLKKSIFSHFQVIIAEKTDIENHYYRANKHCCQWGIFAMEVSSCHCQ